MTFICFGETSSVQLFNQLYWRQKCHNSAEVSSVIQLHWRCCQICQLWNKFHSAINLLYPKQQCHY